MRAPFLPLVREPAQGQLNSELVAALRALKAVPFLDGHLLTDVAVSSAAATPVKHLLGRKLRGWWAVQMGADTTIWQPQAPTDTFLYLRAGVDLKIDIWVF